MRIVVVGTSGSGKTTFSRRIAAALNLPRVEIDALNWLPGWVALNATDPVELQRRVDAATAGEAWVSDGNYSSVRDLLWSRSTHLVWLDYPRHVVMRRVILRSVRRAIDRRELWPGTGNRENWRKWFRASHPIRWAWDTWERRRRQTAERLTLPQNAHLTVLHLTQPREAAGAVRQLQDAATAESGQRKTRPNGPG